MAFWTMGEMEVGMDPDLYFRWSRTNISPVFDCQKHSKLGIQENTVLFFFVFVFFF